MALQAVTVAHLATLCRVCLSFLPMAFSCQCRFLGPQLRPGAADCTCPVLAGGGAGGDERGQDSGPRRCCAECSPGLLASCPEPSRVSLHMLHPEVGCGQGSKAWGAQAGPALPWGGSWGRHTGGGQALLNRPVPVTPEET